MSRTHEPPSRRHMEGPQPPPRPDPKGGPLRPRPAFVPGAGLRPPSDEPGQLYGKRPSCGGLPRMSRTHEPQSRRHMEGPSLPHGQAPRGDPYGPDLPLPPGPVFCPRRRSPADCTEHGLRATDCFACQEPTKPKAGATWKGPSLPHGQTPRGDPYGPDLPSPGTGLLSSWDEPGRLYGRRPSGAGLLRMSRMHGSQSRRHIGPPQPPPRPDPKGGPLRPRPPFSPGDGLRSLSDEPGRLCGRRPSGGGLLRMSRTHEPPSRRHMEGPQPPPRPDPKGGPLRPGPVFPRGRPSVLFGRTRPTVWVCRTTGDSSPPRTHCRSHLLSVAHVRVGRLTAAPGARVGRMFRPPGWNILLAILSATGVRK